MNKLVRHHNKMNIVKAFLVLAVVFAFVNIIPSEGGSSSNSSSAPDVLVLHHKSSFSLEDLSLDLGYRGIVSWKSCPELDSLGKCKELWKTAERKLSSQELQSLSRLVREAKLFDGRANGCQLDLTFTWLEVHARSNVAMLVTTLNNSFSEPGARKNLVAQLHDLEKQMAALSVSKH